MGIIGSDNRQVITSFGTFPYSTVVAVDGLSIITEITDQDAKITKRSYSFGTGIVIAPNHVLSAGHVAYDIDRNRKLDEIRTTISANLNGLSFRAIGASGDPDKNVINVNFLANYDKTEAKTDDIALFTTSNTLIPASNVIGLIAFVDPKMAKGLSIDTAGYPDDNVKSAIPGNSGLPRRDLVRSPGAALAPGEIVDAKSNGRFYYSEDVDTAPGQSGSGVWHTLEGDSKPRVLGIHTRSGSKNNNGVLITTDIYDKIMDQIEADSGVANANELPENAIIGSEPGWFSSLTGAGNDKIFGSYRKERILGKGGNDTLFGGGGDDRLEGGNGVDQALFSDIFTNYYFTITDPSNPAFEFNHTRGSGNDGKDSTKDIEFGIFEFVDANDDGKDDDNNLFFVPLQVDPDDNTKLKDGAIITPEENILDDKGKKIGTLTVISPAWMFDGDVNYTLTIGSEQGKLYNIAYIIDTSGSMDLGGRLLQAKAGYQALTQSLIDNGIADKSVFAVVPFDDFASLITPLSAAEAISTINSLSTGGSTNFGSALAEAEIFFTSSLSYKNATNIAYFLSDGIGKGASDSLQSVAEVRAFGIGRADLSALNIIDSDDAVFLSNPADLVKEFKAATLKRNTIQRIDVKLGGNIIDTITPDQLIEDTLGLRFKGTIDGLEVTRTAENQITFDVVFNNGTPTASLDYKITTGQEQIAEQTDNGTKEIIIFSVIQNDFTDLAENSLINREIVANDLDNTIQVQRSENTIFGHGGNDRFILSGGINLVDGGEGIDTVEINKTKAQAGNISKNGNAVNIGTDNTLLNVEFIKFSDVRLAVDTLAVTPTLSLTNRAILITEGDTGSTLATFTLNLSSITTEDIVINYATRSDYADAGTDFLETTGQLTIAAGQKSGNITLEILGDTDVEGDEALFLDLNVVRGGTFANGATTETAGVNIVDNDSAIDVSITGFDYTIIEGNPDASSTLRVTFDRFGGLNASDTIEAKIIPTGNNPAQASDFVNGFSSIQVTFAPGEYIKTIDIPITPDKQFESDETFGIKLTNISGSALVPEENMILTILNDDAVSNIIQGTSKQDILIGTDAPEQIIGLQSRDTLTGGGGADVFVYTSIMDINDIITDFEVGQDKIDLSSVIDSFNYQGTDAIADGFIKFGAANINDTFVFVDPNGNKANRRSWFSLLLQNVAVNEVADADNFIL